MSEQETIAGLLEKLSIEGDEETFNELFKRLYQKLHGFAMSFVKSEVIAEEIVMDIFMNLWQNRGGLPVIRNIETYLYVSVRSIH